MSAAAQAGWARVDFSTRAAVVLAVASELEARKEALAKLMAIEMGKPLAQGRAEVEKCANACRYFALHSQRFLEDVSIATEHQVSFVHYEPLGVVLAVMPWNYPLFLTVSPLTSVILSVERCTVPEIDEAHTRIPNASTRRTEASVTRSGETARPGRSRCATKM